MALVVQVLIEYPCPSGVRQEHLGHEHVGEKVAVPAKQVSGAQGIRDGMAGRDENAP